MKDEERTIRDDDVLLCELNVSQWEWLNERSEGRMGTKDRERRTGNEGQGTWCGEPSLVAGCKCTCFKYQAAIMGEYINPVTIERKAEVD